MGKSLPLVAATPKRFSFLCCLLSVSKFLLLSGCEFQLSTFPISPFELTWISEEVYFQSLWALMEESESFRSTNGKSGFLAGCFSLS
jgi:hypothetical protein